MQGNSVGESTNSRADKMSGSFKGIKAWIGRSKTKYKKFYNKKRRTFLRDPQNDDKI